MPFDPEIGGRIYSGEDGTLILEAEAADPRGDWSRVNVDGESGLLWDSDRSNYREVDPAETLRYTFRVDENGSYSLGMHSGRIKSVMNASDRFENGMNGAERTDTGNDAYVALKDAVTGEVIKAPTKLFTGLGDADRDLRWGTKFDDSSGHYDAKLQLQAGRIYELEITGRSDGYVLDRITLNKGGVLRDADSAASDQVTIPGEASDAPPSVPDAPDTEPAGSDGSGGGIFDSIMSVFEGIFDAIAGLFGGGSDDDTTVASAEVTASQGSPAVLLSDVVPVIAPIDDSALTNEDDDEISDEMVIV